MPAKSPTPEVAKPYRFKRRSDGTLCIYAPSFNVVIAEFSKGCESDAQTIAALLAQRDALYAALQSLLRYADMTQRFAEEMASHEWQAYLDSTQQARQTLAANNGAVDFH